MRQANAWRKCSTPREFFCAWQNRRKTLPWLPTLVAKPCVTCLSGSSRAKHRLLTAKWEHGKSGTTSHARRDTKNRLTLDCVITASVGLCWSSLGVASDSKPSRMSSGSQAAAACSRLQPHDGSALGEQTLVGWDWQPLLDAGFGTCLGPTDGVRLDNGSSPHSAVRK